MALFSRLSPNQKFTLIIASLAVIVAAGGVWYAKKAVDSNFEIAEKSGAFDKANNYLGFWNLEMPNSSTDTIQLIYGGNFEKGSINVSSFPFSICNYGEKNAEDVELVIEYPTNAYLAVTDTSLLIGNKIPFTKYHRSAIHGKDYQTITYSLNKLNPGVKLTLHEPCVLHKTEIEGGAKTADSVNRDYKVQYSFVFTTTLLGKDLQTQRRIFAITCLEANTMDELIDKHVQTIKRTSSSKNYYYFVFPEKKLFDRRGNSSIHEYKVKDESLYFGTIQDLSEKGDISMALYGNDNKLDKIKVYDTNNILKAAIPIK